MEFIDNEAALTRLCRELHPCSWLAMDTEFERTATYYPELCLLQLANQDMVALIDPLAIHNLDALYALLYDSSMTKVFHSARQDLELFFHIKGHVPLPIFDTQIAASVLGHDEQTGYAGLVKAILGVELEKSQTRTDWKRRPLSHRQLAYAADDVIYLVRLYEVFLARLDESGKLPLLNEQCQVLAESELYAPDPLKMWKKIKAARHIKGKSLAVLKALAAWREVTARQENRPRKWILPDQALVEMARSLPESLDDLSTVKGMSRRVLRNYGAVLLEAISEFPARSAAADLGG